MFSLLKGLIIGLIISAPTGPVGFLTVKRTLVNGLLAGIVTGLGAIASDLVYSSVVIFGLSGVENFFINNQNIIKTIGSIILILLGVFTYFSKQKIKKKIVKEDSNTLIGQWFSSFFITMTNPLQLITFTIIFGTLSIVGIHTFYPFLFLLGLSIGAFIWWGSLAYFVNKFRNRFDKYQITILNKIAGIIIVVCGLVIFGGILLH